ncbi:MAG: DUF1236 domain-containing protein [Pseudorhodoplanes sp.]
MLKRVIAMRHYRCVVLAAIILTLPVASVLAQTGGAGAPEPGIGLTADHKRTIYREIQNEPSRTIPDGSEIAIGAGIPDSVILNEIPIAVKDRVGLLRDFKFAKVADETIVIVDPAKRQIVDIVTKTEGSR